MALTPAQIQDQGSSTKLYAEGLGENDNDVIVQADEILEYDTFQLMSTAGALDVVVSLDGENYSQAPYSLVDLGATSVDPVLVTVANRIYGFRGRFKSLRVLQNGATPPENVTLMCSRSSRGRY